jgi:hypothetical protein
VLTQLGLLGHASPRGNEDSSPGSGK